MDMFMSQDYSIAIVTIKSCVSLYRSQKIDGKYSQRAKNSCLVTNNSINFIINVHVLSYLA